MSFVEFVNFLHEHGLDVILLGLFDSLLHSLLQKLFAHFGKEVPKKLLTASHFLSGLLLYALWLPIAVPNGGTEVVPSLTQGGLGVGGVATIWRALTAKSVGQEQGTESEPESKDEESE